MTEASIASSPRHRWWSGVEILGWLASQGTRLVLWLPVMLGAGIAVYFALPIEPHWWLGPLGLGLGVLALVVLRNAGLVMRAAIYGGAALALGFTAAQWQTETVAAPQLDRSTGPTTVTGRVVSRDVSSAGTRVVLDTPTIENLAFEETPERVRVRLTTRSVTPDIGAHIALTAVLNPPGSPVLPGGFDFRRYAFFQRLGAVGYAVSRPTVTAEAEAGGLSLQLERLRHGIAGRVDDAVARGLVSDRAGSVAIVLLTGDRSAISDNLYSDMRRSGLAHLLAISGLHVGLIAGLVFFGIRAVLALSPALALRYPIKKWAALAAIAAAFAYMLIVGATVPTQRAFLMTSLVLFAVLIDRLAISLRLVALAAAVVLLISPSSLTGPSFQMSFAAVLALVALYDGLRDRWGTWTAQPGLARRACLYLGGLMITSFTATLATAPFVLYHFQETPVYGPLANLVAVPLTASWIMPWGLAAYLLMPFGLETLALVPMGWGIDLLLELAHWFATQPGAVVATPALPTLAIVLVIAGGTWLALWRGKVRWFGFAGVPAAIMVAVLSPVPSILVSQDAGLIGLRLPDNTLAVSQMRRDSFTREQWARLTGADQVISWTDLAAADPGFRCDGQGCVWQIGTATIAFVFDPAIAAEECALSIVVVSQEPIRRPCAAPILIDRFDVWRNGAYSLNVPIDAVTADEFVDLTTVRTVAEQTGHRPWSRSIQ